jgi:hypothetical protein
VERQTGKITEAGDSVGASAMNFQSKLAKRLRVSPMTASLKTGFPMIR